MLPGLSDPFWVSLLAKVLATAAIVVAVSTSIPGSRTCMLGSIGERTGRYQPAACTSPRRTAPAPAAIAALEDKIVQGAAAGC